MVEEYEEIADPPERTDDPDDDLGKSWDGYDPWKVGILVYLGCTITV